MPTAPHPFFLPVEVGQGGQRFCLFHSAQGQAARGSILYVHPFTEEMNKSRRMAAKQSRALACVGYDVLQIDLLGCGDSSGDFGEATWQQWVSDVLHGCRWLRSRNVLPHAAATVNPPLPPLWLWGLRAGCLLAVDAAMQLDEQCNFLFWQPPSSGKPLLQQFLRLKMASDILGGQTNGAVESLHQQLAGGNAVEVAGYMLSAELATGVKQALLLPPANPNRTRRLEWLELSTREEANLNPVSNKTIALWQQAGYVTRSHVVHGPSFWQTTEIEDAPALVAATVAAVSGTTVQQQAVNA
jgi:uncharacterized protein